MSPAFFSLTPFPPAAPGRLMPSRRPGVTLTCFAFSRNEYERSFRALS